MRWVNETLPPRARARWLLMTMRLSNSSLTGTVRTLVAVGTVEADVHVLGGAHRRAAQRGQLSARRWPRRGSGRAFSLGTGRVAVFAVGLAPGLGRRLGLRLRRRLAVGLAVGLGLGLGLRLGRRASAAALRRGVLGVGRFASRLPSALWLVASARPWRAVRARRCPARRGLEELPPGPVDAVGVLLVTLVHLVHEPLVGAEVAIGSAGCGLVVLDRLGHVLRSPLPLRLLG